jgi:shikimate kinase
LFIGGGPGAGKTSISRALAYRWDLQLYNVDHRTYEHANRLGRPPPDWSRSPAELVEDFVEASHRRWPLVLEDLAALPESPAVIAEGPFFLPELVPAESQSVFLVPSAAQIRRVRAERGSRPVVADRDVLLAARIPGLPVDRPLPEMIELVASLFSLDGLPRAADRPAIRERRARTTGDVVEGVRHGARGRLAAAVQLRMRHAGLRGARGADAGAVCRAGV